METKKYYRLMLGAKSVHAAECLEGNFVGVGFGIDQDLADDLPDRWKEFNKGFCPRGGCGHHDHGHGHDHGRQGCGGGCIADLRCHITFVTSKESGFCGFCPIITNLARQHLFL